VFPAPEGSPDTVPALSGVPIVILDLHSLTVEGIAAARSGHHIQDETT
jgi:hypothetical protein